MRGLLKKDLYTIVSEISWMNFIVLIMPVVIGMANPQMLLPMLCLILSFVFSYELMLTFSSDEAVNWQKNQSAMPVSVFQAAGSKYLLFLLLAAISVLLELVVGVLIICVFLPEYGNLLFSSILFGLVFIVLYCTVMIPATYQFGTNRSRHILLLLVLAVSLTPLAVSNLVADFSLTALLMAPEAIYPVLFTALLVLTVLSFFITVLILRRKTPSIQ